MIKIEDLRWKIEELRLKFETGNIIK